MEWNELVIKTSQEAKEAIANLLNESGANGVVIEEALRWDDKANRFGEFYELAKEKFNIEGAIIKAYFLNDADWGQKQEALVKAIKDLANYEINLGNLSITVNQVAESDWENEWKKYYKPFRVTDRFTIVPTWESYEQKDSDEQLILMDPGMAFGTGTHPTTKLSLAALEKYVKKGDVVIDVGSGSGILSIAACLLKAKHVYSYDLDQVAVSSTIYNRDLNNLTNKITVRQNDLLKNVMNDELADVVVANILAHIILELIADAKKQLKQGGVFITSGILQKNANDVEERLAANDFSIIDKFTEENWVTFIARKKIK